MIRIGDARVAVMPASENSVGSTHSPRSSSCLTRCCQGVRRFMGFNSPDEGSDGSDGELLLSTSLMSIAPIEIGAVFSEERNQLEEVRRQLEEVRRQLKEKQLQLEAGQKQLEAGQRQLKVGKDQLKADKAVYDTELTNLSSYQTRDCIRNKGLSYVLRNQRGTEAVGSGSDNRARYISIGESSRLSMVSKSTKKLLENEQFVDKKIKDESIMTGNLKKIIEAAFSGELADESKNNQTLKAMVEYLSPQTYSEFETLNLINDQKEQGFSIKTKNKCINVITIKKRKDDKDLTAWVFQEQLRLSNISIDDFLDRNRSDYLDVNVGKNRYSLLIRSL